MIKTLEFNLKNKRTNGVMVYEVQRKGLNVGTLVLEEPYNNINAEMTQMTLHNELIKQEKEITKSLIKDEREAQKEIMKENEMI